MTSEEQIYPQELLDSAEALTRFVAADEGFEETLKRLAELSVKAIEGADYCSISLLLGEDKKMQNIAATNPAGFRIDELQIETQQGPCLAALTEHEAFVIKDMQNDDRWPLFTRKAAEETGTLSMLSFVLRLADDATGAMNLSAGRKEAFSDQDFATGMIFAAQVAVAIKGLLARSGDRKEIEELKEGLKTREVIGEAVGILMAKRGQSSDEAFQTLVKVSQDTNLKLRDIAKQVVEKVEDV